MSPSLETVLLEEIRAGGEQAEFARLAYADLLEEGGNALRASMVRRQGEGRGARIAEAMPELAWLARKCGAKLTAEPRANPPFILVENGFAVEACMGEKRWLRWGKQLAAAHLLGWAGIVKKPLRIWQEPESVLAEQVEDYWVWGWPGPLPLASALVRWATVHECFWNRLGGRTETVQHYTGHEGEMKTYATEEAALDGMSEAILGWAYGRED